MELSDLIQQRRMTRSFDGSPVSHTELSELCAEALRAPTAGNSAGVSMWIVPGEMYKDFFSATTDPVWRSTARRSPGLSRAGGAVIITVEPDAYTRRYSESDKADAQLTDQSQWKIPYWYFDAGMATMSLLLLLKDRAIDAVVWGNFRDESRIRRLGDLPDSQLITAYVLVGYADGRDEPSESLSRQLVTRHQRVQIIEANPVSRAT